MEKIIVSMQNAGITFKGFAMADICIDIPKGYITGIEGRNGAGKTTLIKMILGLYPKMSGTIRVCGWDAVRERTSMLTQVGFISEERAFFKEYDAVDNEKFYAPYYKNWDGEMYREMLKRMSVSLHTKIGHMSKGTLMKFQTAFACAVHPELLVMDEPTAGLDPVFRAEFLKILQTLVAEEDMTILMSTNITSDLDKIADYMIDVQDGACSIRESGVC